MQKILRFFAKSGNSGNSDVRNNHFRQLLKNMLLDATLPEATTDCYVANTIVNCYYWSFEVANVVAKGRVREKDKENVVKGHAVKHG